MAHIKGYECTICNSQYEGNDILHTCPKCGQKGILEIIYDYKKIKQSLSKAYLANCMDYTIWRYSSLISVDQPNLVIETIKKAQDGNGLIIRLYESQRGRGPFTLHAGFPIEKAHRTNILEENQETLKVEENQISGNYKPYQIITLRVIPEQRKP